MREDESRASAVVEAATKPAEPKIYRGRRIDKESEEMFAVPSIAKVSSRKCKPRRQEEERNTLFGVAGRELDHVCFPSFPRLQLPGK